MVSNRRWNRHLDFPIPILDIHIYRDIHKGYIHIYRDIHKGYSYIQGYPQGIFIYTGISTRDETRRTP